MQQGLHLISPAHSTRLGESMHSGRKAMELSKWGFHQTEELLERHQVEFNEAQHDRILTSPDPRCLSMSALFAERLTRPPKIIKSWLGVDLGDWNALSMEEIKRVDSSRLEQWFRDENFPAPGGESVMDVSRRVWPEFVQEVEQMTEGERLIIFAPAMVIALLTSRVLEMPAAASHQLRIAQAATVSFELNAMGFYQLTRWNHPWNAVLKGERDDSQPLEREPSFVV